MFVVNEEVTVSWVILATSTVYSNAHFSITVKKPNGSSQHHSSAISASNFEAPDAENPGLAEWFVTPDQVGVWIIELIVNESGESRVYAKHTMRVSEPDTHIQQQVKIEESTSGGGSGGGQSGSGSVTTRYVDSGSLTVNTNTSPITYTISSIEINYEGGVYTVPCADLQSAPGDFCDGEVYNSPTENTAFIINNLPLIDQIDSINVVINDVSGSIITLSTTLDDNTAVSGPIGSNNSVLMIPQTCVVTGSVAVENGSNVVTGSGVDWTADGIVPGYIFTVITPDYPGAQVEYEIADMNSSILHLWDNWAGDTGSNLAYKICPPPA